jgi:predicted CoA-substrate-specific enzyme activase
MKALGICLGASSVSLVEAHQEESLTCRVLISRRHEGRPLEILSETLKNLPLTEFSAVAATGRKLCNFLNLSVITEPEASEYALEYVNQKKESFDALVSCGGETFMVYTLNKQLKISNASTGSKCASGTGEFFLQQIRRMNIGIDEALQLASGTVPFRVSGRCSVFCKSDCTHALNHGHPLGGVISGLCEMMAEKIAELMPCGVKSKVMIIGGVSQNYVAMQYLRKHLKDIYVPEQACYFEALGAALWAMKNKTKSLDLANIFKKPKFSFSFLPSLRGVQNLVSFKELSFCQAKANDECVLGLDVGSTTTKAIILRLSDDAILASVYLRTNGQPVEAARGCYRELISNLSEEINIVGLGTTGSGRQIAGLHALTRNVINEIIAHARAAVYFDKEVDTIFEIGGQDAKYTHLVNAVPCDYAMNEACSAGTGSFLEEACRELFGLEMQDIADIALRSKSSPNFSDQCAAFISSDIKTAIHEGVEKEDIVGGLVYSICMNYINRVKGSRPVGKKIFMQGGVCYNKAVPLAMAVLINKHIVVPPHPGLMGAFGVALELKERLKLGISQKEKFDLRTLAGRSVEYGRPFNCGGSQDGCDRKCNIAVVKLEGRNYSFGGSCSKYYNLRFGQAADVHGKDLVLLRQKMLFSGYQIEAATAHKRTVGLNLSFLTHSLFPLYHSFFKNLGFRVILPAKVNQEGIRMQGSNFCYPASLAHGLFLDLIQKKPDFIFLPQITEIPVKNAISREPEHQSTCLILQAEAYYLKTAFKAQLFSQKIINPVLNFSQGYLSEKRSFMRMAKGLGRSRKKCRKAYKQACLKQDEFIFGLKKRGKELMSRLKENPEEIAVVLFGRPYNAFCPEVNLGIPQKFASKGITIIPFDFLPYEFAPYKGPSELFGKNLTWAFGQMILKAASFIQQHPQLFAVYVTNFSCGPDSFLLTYFREIMKDKPSLTLEIDSHTAQAGIDTRIEAFLDILERYRHLKKLNVHFQAALLKDFSPAELFYEGKSIKVISSDHKTYSLSDPKVHLLIPSMGDLATEALTASFNRIGVHATALGVPDPEVLKYGRAFTSGKECLPLIITCGSILKYLEENKNKDEIVVYFMPTVGGNCRFSQYSVFLKNLIRRNHLRNVAILSLSSENSYMGLGSRFMATVLKAVVICDAMDDIRNALAVLPKDKDLAMHLFRQEWNKILYCLKSPSLGKIERQLAHTAGVLKSIPLKYPAREAKFVSLLGEIFIRKELFSRQGVIQKLHQREIIPRVASILEWFYYVDYLIKKGKLASNFNLKTGTEFFLKHSLQHIFERRIKGILSRCGFYFGDPVDIHKLVRHGKDFVPLELTGEPVIVIGAALSEILHSICGVISIGPFSCLPTRVTEAILSKEMCLEIKSRYDREKGKVFKDLSGLPFLSVEVDGNPLPPVFEARLEAFCLQAERVHQLMQRHNN